MRQVDGTRVVVPDLFSSHLEADDRIALHANYASSPGTSVCVVANDTDVFILLLYIASGCVSTLYFRQGTTKSKAGVTYHNVTELASFIGNDICKILPPFHALTGSDFTKPFYRRSKINSFKKIISNPSYESFLISPSTDTPNILDVQDFIIHVIYNLPKKEKTPADSWYSKNH